MRDLDLKLGPVSELWLGQSLEPGFLVLIRVAVERRSSSLS